MNEKYDCEIFPKVMNFHGKILLFAFYNSDTMYFGIFFHLIKSEIIFLIIIWKNFLLLDVKQEEEKI